MQPWSYTRLLALWDPFPPLAPALDYEFQALLRRTFVTHRHDGRDTSVTMHPVEASISLARRRVALSHPMGPPNYEFDSEIYCIDELATTIWEQTFFDETVCFRMGNRNVSGLRSDVRERCALQRIRALMPLDFAHGGGDHPGSYSSARRIAVRRRGSTRLGEYRSFAPWHEKTVVLPKEKKKSRAPNSTAVSGGTASGGTASGGTASGGTASGGTGSGGTASGGIGNAGNGSITYRIGVEQMQSFLLERNGRLHSITAERFERIVCMATAKECAESGPLQPGVRNTTVVSTFDYDAVSSRGARTDHRRREDDTAGALPGGALLDASRADAEQLSRSLSHALEPDESKCVDLTSETPRKAARGTSGQYWDAYWGGGLWTLGVGAVAEAGEGAAGEGEAGEGEAGVAEPGEAEAGEAEAVEAWEAPPRLWDAPIGSEATVAQINEQVGLGWTAGDIDSLFPIAKSLGDLAAMLGTRMGPMALAAAPHLSALATSSTAVPKAFDAREKWPSCAHSIGLARNQGGCGSCWAFGAVEAFGDRICIESGGRVNARLSPQELIDCDPADNGCGGGYLDDAWRFLVSSGASTEECNPYRHCTDPLFTNCSGPGHPANRSAHPAHRFNGNARNSNGNRGARIGGDDGVEMSEATLARAPPSAAARAVMSETPRKTCNASCVEGSPPRLYHASAAYRAAPVGGVDAIQREILAHGPLEAAFFVFSDFVLYRSGVYRRSQAARGPLGGHAVKLIGWGEEEDGEKYWLAVNSWSPQWGDHGVFRIRRGTNECGIESQAAAGLPVSAELQPQAGRADHPKSEL